MQQVESAPSGHGLRFAVAHNLGFPSVWVALVAGLAFFSFGCKKETASSVVIQADASPVNPDLPPDEQEKARIAQAVALRERIEPAPPALKLRGGELATPEVLAAYNQELLRLIFREGDAPETLQELVRKKTLPRLPTPPPGKQIVYDAKYRIIRLEAR